MFVNPIMQHCRHAVLRNIYFRYIWVQEGGAKGDHHFKAKFSSIYASWMELSTYDNSDTEKSSTTHAGVFSYDVNPHMTGRYRIKQLKGEKKIISTQIPTN